MKTYFLLITLTAFVGLAWNSQTYTPKHPVSGMARVNTQVCAAECGKPVKFIPMRGKERGLSKKEAEAARKRFWANSKNEQKAVSQLYAGGK